MVEIPAELVEAQVRWGGAAGREFIEGLPGRVAEFLGRWGLRETGPGMHGMTALVVPVERADGTPAALKLLVPDEESVGEPVALRAWDGRGCVRLLEHDAVTGTLLLERLDEGRHLSGLAERDSRAAVRVVGELLARLTSVAAPEGLRGLGEMAAAMLAEAPRAAGRLADAGERRLLRDCAAALAEVAGEPGDRLLHWDLHFDNVLAGAREPWLVIDPKPLSGDPGFELLPSIVNGFRADEVGWRFDLLTEAAGVDRERARAWTLGRVLQNCLWEVEDGEEELPEREVVVAELLLGR
ncbi:aminoglycoside phosphotransferase family protein [Streptomyces sp. NBC_00249]|uniref:aminoglycoside phosphotransferase family protein n=1 Tax=Streptomyces sp. NBC_00249 TaxID=2975690 RepID=UPI002254C430|nr:aminoglycoside phosphotransferase family protein [Streptomyces sp. NBC_00249]MCX5198733.1 aminoglycoside phosphotransferase family protein [Streptomyces sp. NBC_00249]